MNRIILFIIYLLFATTCSAQSICEQLTLLKQQAYGFKPSKLTRKQIDERLIPINKFWDLAKKNQQESEVCLRQMILAEKSDPYFCYDASSLLLSISTQQPNMDVAVEGLNKCDLNDLQLDSYLNICFFLGSKGEDIGALAEKLISYPNAQIFLVEHALTLNAIDASLFLYNVMGTSKSEDALLHAVENGNATAQYNAAVVLNLISTPKGDSLINKLLDNHRLADSTIAFIKKDRESFMIKTSCSESSLNNRAAILRRLKAFPSDNPEKDTGFAGNDKLICAASKLLLSQDVGAIRAARDRSTRDLSDESLDEYFALTRILMTVRHR